MPHRADHDAAGPDDYAPPSSARGGAPGKSTLTSRLWRSARRDDRGVAPGAEEAVAGLGGGGAPLPAGVRDRFEASLGADLGAVRVHTDDASANAADAVGARAFARGNDIHFGAGQYQPDDPFGMHLLAHEVAHTVQQSGGAATTHYKLAVSSPGDAAEVEADRAADAMVAGEAARVGGGATTAIARSAVGPVYNHATVVGTNHDKTIDWNNPPQLYGLAGDHGTSLRAQYREHLRQHLGAEPDIVKLGAGLDPDPIVARLHDIEQRQQDAATAKNTAGEAGVATSGLFDGFFDGSSGAHALGDTLPSTKRPPTAGGAATVDVAACRKALWRSAQRAIADTLSTETSDARYKKKGGTTYCNVYATDMVNAMGGYLPRVWYADLGIAKKLTLEEMQKNNVPVVELSANNIGAWLAKWGGDFGWQRTADAKQAQAAANSGQVAIIQASKADGIAAGHVGVIMAEGAGHAHTTAKDGSFQPLQSQAGASNFEYSDTAKPGAGISDTWWKGDGMKAEPAGNFYIYKGKHQATAVDGAAAMGKA